MKFFRRSQTQVNRVRNAGFSLIETMMGSMVMTMVLAGSFSALSQGVDMANRARNEQFADRILNNEVQYLRTLSWNEINQSNIDGLEAKPYSHAETVSFLSGTREYFDGNVPLRDLKLDVDHTSSHSSTRKHIELTLTWKEISGRDMSRTVTFSYSKNGIYDSYCPVL